MLKDRALDLGGRCAVNPSGGLIAMGHPIVPTGIGQIGEAAMQLRGEAGLRQHAGRARPQIVAVVAASDSSLRPLLCCCFRKTACGQAGLSCKQHTLSMTAHLANRCLSCRDRSGFRN